MPLLVNFVGLFTPDLFFLKATLNKQNKTTNQQQPTNKQPTTNQQPNNNQTFPTNTDASMGLEKHLGGNQSIVPGLAFFQVFPRQPPPHTQGWFLVTCSFAPIAGPQFIRQVGDQTTTPAIKRGGGRQTELQSKTDTETAC